jgi:hypothetical protein
MRTTVTLPILLLSLSLTGCWFGRKKTPKVPVNLPVPTGAPKSTLPPLPQDPFPQTPPPAKAPPAQSTEGEPPVENPPPQRRRPSGQKPSPAPKSVEILPPPVDAPVPAPSPTPPQAPPPRLGEVLDEETRRQYETELTNHLASAEAAVQKTAGRQLTLTQRETVQRIQSFIAQARQAKDRDLSTALQLARRADLLGHDLSASLP